MKFSAAWTDSPCSLVTGALGFVGLHLVRTLLVAGHTVVGLGKHGPDNPLPPLCGPFRQDGPAGGIPRAVCFTGAAGSFAYLPLDLQEPAGVEEFLLGIRPALIFHLAAQSSAALSFAQPRETIGANLIGTLNLLEGLRALPEAQRPAMLAVGSCEEYGPHPPGRQPLGEETPLAPVSPYGVSKAAQTLLCRQYAATYDVPVVVARSFNHTGPGQDTRFALPSFARQIAAAEAGAGPAEIQVGNLDAVRDFLDVRDVIAAYRRLIRDGEPGEVYNVCSGTALTIGQGLDILIGLATLPVTVKADPARQRPSDTPILVGDNEKLRARTGWEPEWDITRTLSDMLAEARKEFS